MQFRESCDATCIDENTVIDEGNENMINNEVTDEDGYVNYTELNDSSFGDTPEKNHLIYQWVILVQIGHH